MKRTNEWIRNTLGPEIAEGAQHELELALIGGAAMQIAEQSGLSRREIARRMGLKSPSLVQRLLQRGAISNVTVTTLLRFARACGHRIEVRIVPLEQNDAEHAGK